MTDQKLIQKINDGYEKAVREAMPKTAKLDKCPCSRVERLVSLISAAQLLAQELGMGRDVTANLGLAKMNATPLLAAGDSPNAPGEGPGATAKKDTNAN